MSKRSYEGVSAMKFYEKSSLFFTGFVYIIAGVLILIYPKFLYYGVAGVFLIHGLASFIRAWEKKGR